MLLNLNSALYILKDYRLLFSHYSVSSPLKIVLSLANTNDPDKMSHSCQSLSCWSLHKFVLGLPVNK